MWDQEAIEYLRREMAKPDFTPATDEERAQGIEGHYRYRFSLLTHVHATWAQMHGLSPATDNDKFYGYLTGRLAADEVGIPAITSTDFAALPQDIQDAIDRDD